MIIGYIGINHNGDIETALKLIDVAVENELEVVKFQKRSPRLCVPKKQWNKDYETRWGTMKYIDYKERMEFGKEEFDIIDAYCNEVEIDWTASVWDEESLKFIMDYDVPFLKVASPCITDYDLLHAISDYDIPVIMSTGMSNEAEIKNAAFMLENNIASILYCKSVYPTADEDVQLMGLYRLQSMFPEIEIGYSGHEIGYFPSLMARMLGVNIFERHITLDTEDMGTDHKISLDPQMLQEFVTELGRIDTIMGLTYEIDVIENEIPFKKKLRG
jgi:sialic acid synthase SpsE